MSVGAPDEMKLACGCYAKRGYGAGVVAPGAGVAGPGWVITATAFLCDVRHTQGDFLDVVRK